MKLGLLDVLLPRKQRAGWVWIKSDLKSVRFHNWRAPGQGLSFPKRQVVKNTQSARFPTCGATPLRQEITAVRKGAVFPPSRPFGQPHGKNPRLGRALKCSRFAPKPVEESQERGSLASCAVGARASASASTQAAASRKHVEILEASLAVAFGGRRASEVRIRIYWKVVVDRAVVPGKLGEIIWKWGCPKLFRATSTWNEFPRSRLRPRGR